MLKDVYIERIIRREATAGTKVLQVLVVVGALAVLLTVLTIPYTIMYAPVVIILLFFLCRNLIQRLNIEFEYLLTGQELSVDILIGQRQRRRMLSLKTADILSMRTAREFAVAKPTNIVMTYDAASSEQSDTSWIAQFRNGKNVCILIFEPDERMLESLRRSNPGAFPK